MPPFIKKILQILLPQSRYDRLRRRFWDWRNERKQRQKQKKRHPIQELRRRADRFFTFRLVYPALYRRHSREPIDENKVLLVEPSKPFSDNFELLYRELTEHYDYDIHIHLLRNFFLPAKEYKERCRALVRDIATAKYVFFDEGSNVLGRVHLRRETQVAQIWHACGAFKKFGFSTADLLFGSTRREMEAYPNYRYDSFVTVSSPEITWAYAEAMGLPEEKILPLGVSRTDIFFDPDFLARARRKFEFYMPSAKGKKVILFAPTFRGRVAKATTATAFSVEQFCEALSDDYVLVLKHHPYIKKPPLIPEKYQSFAADFTRTMTIEELLCVADLCISDYSSLVFEYSLFEKPMLFFDYDIDEYFDWRGFYYNYDELTPGPAFKTNREMIDYIQHIDERFDRQQVIDFREKFMSSCDGHSTERLMKQMFGESLAGHRREAAALPETEEEKPVSTKAFAKKVAALGESAPKIRARLDAEHPELAGKTLIAFFTAGRQDRGFPPSPPCLDWSTLFEYLDERYCVLYMGAIPSPYRPKKYQRSRFLDTAGLFDGESFITDASLALIADFVITDFCPEPGSWCLERKPTLIYLPDYRWYCADEDDYRNSTAFLREQGLFFENTKELIPAIEGYADPAAGRGQDTLRAYREVCRHYTPEQT